MSVNLSPFGPKPAFFDSSGNQLNGGKLFFYASGSTTPQSTFTDSTGATANANPVVLNSRGEPTNEIWLTAGLSYKAVLKTSADVTIWTVDNIVGINDTTVTIDQWVAGPAPTFINATSFTMVGDQTQTFHVGRRVKTTNSGGTIYSTITASSFVATTTVTVENDSGVLDAGLSAVSYGMVSAANGSSPVPRDDVPVVAGATDPTKRMRFEVDGFTAGQTRVGTPPDYNFRIMSQTKGADIASAATIDLDAATGDLVDVTGTTTITAITLAEGRMATVRFTGALTLSNGASLVLPSGANITTVAGDFAVFRGYASSVVRCVVYSKANGKPVIEQGLVKLNSGTVSAAATLDIVMTSYTAFKHKKLVLHLLPATDAVALDMRFSSDGGGTFNAGATDYGIEVISGGATTTSNTSGITLSGGGLIGNVATEGWTGEVSLYETTDAAKWTLATFAATVIDSAATPVVRYPHGSGARRAAQDTDAVRFLFSSGNIASGAWELYGWN